MTQQSLPVSGTLPLLLAVAVVGSNSLSLGPIAPAVAVDLQTSVETVMIASAGFGFGTAVGALLLARWVDYFGPVIVLRISFTILLVAMLGCALSPSIPVLVISQIVSGVAAGVALPAVYSRAGQIAPAGHESRVLGMVLVGWTISMVAGVSLAALIAGAIGWRSVYFFLTLLSLLVMISVFFMRERGARSEVNANGRVAPSPLRALAVPDVPHYLILVALYMVAFYACYAFIGDHVVSVLQRPVGDNGGIAISYGLGFGLAAFADGLLDRLGNRRAAPLTLFMLVFVYLLLSIPMNFGALLGVCFLWGLFNHLGVNVLIAALSAADVEQRGTVLGLYSGVTYLCMSLATLAAGFIYPSAGWHALTLSAMCMCALAAALAVRQNRSLTSPLLTALKN